MKAELARHTPQKINGFYPQHNTTQTCESASSAPNTAYHHISGLQNHKVKEWESWL
jgi:hypothetical protein